MHGSLALGQREARFAVERAEMLGLDEVDADTAEPAEQFQHFALRDRTAFGCPEAAPPMVGAEGLGQTLRPVF